MWVRASIAFSSNAGKKCAEGFCGWQPRWMMIRRNEFFSHSQNKSGKKLVKGMHLMGKREKKINHLPMYWFLLNCQRSIFLTVSLFFLLKHPKRFYRAMPNANKTIVGIPLSVGVHTLPPASDFPSQMKDEKIHKSRVYWFIL